MVLSIAIGLLVVSLFLLRYRLTFWKRRGIPQNDPWTPLGDFLGAGSWRHPNNIVDETYKRFKKLGPIFGFYLMLKPTLFITDLDLLRDILVKDFHIFTDRGLYHNEEADPLTISMLNVEGQEWKRLRTALSPTFTSGKMKGMFQIVREKGEDLVKFFERNSGKPDGVLLRNVNARYTADVIAATSFGLETRALCTDNPEILDILRDVFGGSSLNMMRVLFITTAPSVSRRLGIRQFDKHIEQFFRDAIDAAIEHRSRSNLRRHDFLDMLINLMNRGTISATGPENPEGKLSFNEILAQAFLFYAGGFETSSMAMSYAMYYVARDKVIQERLRREIREVKAKHGGEITYDALADMTYLNQVFSETLRIKPPISVLIRNAKEDYRVSNSTLVIPKGTLIQIPIYSIHHDPEHYPDPERFDPNRFSPEEIAKRHQYSFLTFGEGPRNCIGMRFGILQSKYGLAVAVDNFEMTVNRKTIEPIEFDVKTTSNEVKGGLWVNFKKITRD